MESPPLPSNCTAYPGTATHIKCKGEFKSGQAATLCPAGYVLATSMPPELAQACASQSSQFFAADLPVWGNPNNPRADVVCNQQSNWYPGTMGCGADPAASVTTVPTCGQWPAAIIFSRSTSWASNTGGLGTAANVNPEHGVICRRL